MAVTETFQLNQQPTVGSSRLVPLGGNGVTAPKSMYEVAATLAGAAGGGTNVITIQQDPRFSSLMTLANSFYIGAAAGIEVLFSMRDERDNGPFARGFGNAVPIGIGGSLTVWNPPPIMTMDEWSLTVNNVDGDSSIFNAWFYNFDIRILELSPMWQILANLPRGGTMDSFSA